MAATEQFDYSMALFDKRLQQRYFFEYLPIKHGAKVIEILRRYIQRCYGIQECPRVVKHWYMLGFRLDAEARDMTTEPIDAYVRYKGGKVLSQEDAIAAKEQFATELEQLCREHFTEYVQCCRAGKFGTYKATYVFATNYLRDQYGLFVPAEELRLWYTRGVPQRQPDGKYRRIYLDPPEQCTFWNRQAIDAFVRTVGVHRLRQRWRRRQAAGALGTGCIDLCYFWRSEERVPCMPSELYISGRPQGDGWTAAGTTIVDGVVARSDA